MHHSFVRSFPCHGIPYTLKWSERLENSTVIVINVFTLLEQLQRRWVCLRPLDKVSRSPYFQTDDWNAVIEGLWLKHGTIAPEVFRDAFDRLMDTLKGPSTDSKGQLGIQDAVCGAQDECLS